MVWWVVVGFSILLLMIILFSRLYITFQYIYNHGSEVIYVVVRLYNVRIYQKEMDPPQIFTHSTIWEDWKDKTFLERIQYAPKGVKATFKQLQEKYKMTLQQLQKIHIHQFNWKTECGTGNATSAGMVCGAIWTAKGMLVGMLKNKLKMVSQPHIEVTPYFQQPILTSHMHCIVSITIGKAILAFLHTTHPVSGKKLQE